MVTFDGECCSEEVSFDAQCILLSEYSSSLNYLTIQFCGSEAVFQEKLNLHSVMSVQQECQDGCHDNGNDSTNHWVVPRGQAIERWSWRNA